MNYMKLKNDKKNNNNDLINYLNIKHDNNLNPRLYEKLDLEFKLLLYRELNKQLYKKLTEHLFLELYGELYWQLHCQLYQRLNRQLIILIYRQIIT